jgi:alpha-tubulin suppressor-like RCC1 family protein
MGRLALVLVALAPAVFVSFAACDSADDAMTRTSIPVPEDASDEDAPTLPDAAIEDASSDVDASADAAKDAGPSGARYVATGAGPHPTVGNGDHSCAIAGLERSVYCWGANDHGQIGNGVASDAGVPEAGLDGGLAVDVASATRLLTDETGQPFDGADALSLAAWHSCARKGNALYCWGQRYSGAQAEPPSAANADRTKPRSIGGLTIAAVAAGGPHTCALRTSGKITCFGHSYFNELGRARSTDPTCDAPIFYAYPSLGGASTCSGEALDMDMAINTVDQVVSGELHSCALANGHVYCWGTNTNGELGTPGAGFAELNPQVVVTDEMNLTPLANASAIASGGGKHTCALVAGKVSCWGSNASGELGADPASVTQRPSAAEIAGLDAVTSIGVGDGVSCAVKSDGTAACWGADDAGQLGDGVPKASSFTPALVKGPGGTGVLDKVTQIAPGRRHVCALRSDATVWCWGKNDRGQLGDGTKADSLFPVKVSGLPP